MEFKLKIEAPELSNAINNLAAALSGGGAPGGWLPGGGEVELPTKAVQKDTKAPVKEDTPGPAKEVPTKAEEKAPETDSVPGLSFEQVRVKLAEVSQKGKQKELKALITSFGAAKLSDILESQYAELLEKAADL